jgi:phosphoribosyl 1,2-cyclic phosphodiesterase
MEMYFCPLYSGSSGNALFCQYGNTRLLIDAGKTGSCLTAALQKIRVDPETISGVLITHEHSDHIQGAGVIARKYHLPLYATQETWRAMEGKLGKIPGDLIRTVQSGKGFWLGDIGVEPFSIPHDAADPVGYRLWGGNMSLSTATDLGVFSENVYSSIAGSTLVLLESNHDPEMLRSNPHYAPALKQRILSDRGHLSNDACAAALLRLIAGGTGSVILGHLRGENNTPGLARRVPETALNREGILPGRDVGLQVALRDEVGEVYCIRERTAE